MSTRGWLIALSYSPWSEKARWALVHHRVSFREIPYTPLLGEPVLRALTRKWTGTISVPLFVHAGNVIEDSFAIAEYANGIGAGSPLGFALRHSDLVEWNTQSETLLRAGRAIVLERTLASPGSLVEASPSFLPVALRRGMLPVAREVSRYLQRKYHATVEDPDRVFETMRTSLDALRARLSDGRRYILEDFSFADIAMAGALQMVSPVADRFVRMGPATRAVFTFDDIARDYRDLLAWRDELYEDHRHAD